MTQGFNFYCFEHIPDLIYIIIIIILMLFLTQIQHRQDQNLDRDLKNTNSQAGLQESCFNTISWPWAWSMQNRQSCNWWLIVIDWATVLHSTPLPTYLPIELHERPIPSVNVIQNNYQYWLCTRISKPASKIHRRIQLQDLIVKHQQLMTHDQWILNRIYNPRVSCLSRRYLL